MPLNRLNLLIVTIKLRRIPMKLSLKKTFYIFVVFINFNIYSLPSPKGVFGIVDPFSSGRDFANALKERGWECVAIYSGVSYKEHFTSNSIENNTDTNHCKYTISTHSDINHVLEEAEKFNINFILAGSEDGVLYADKLNDHLGLKFNGMKKSLARRDKSLMHQEVKKAGLKVPEQTTINSFEQGRRWIQKNKINFPVVIKPKASCSSDGVYICHDWQQLKIAVKSNLNNTDIFNNVMDELLIQEFIDGNEYVVNGVSFDGKHYFTDIWASSKSSHNGSDVVYESIKNLLPNDLNQQVLKNYAQKVLDALDFQIGPSHMEIKINGQGEPILIEVGARIAGTNMHRLTRHITHNSKSQLEYTLDAYINPSLLSDISKAPSKNNKFAMSVYFISKKSGTLQTLGPFEKITSLKSYRSHDIYAQIGKHMPKTTDLGSSPGQVFLVNDRQDALQEDYLQVRKIENELFKITENKQS